MSWTKIDYEGQVMWERDGERVKEVPDERRVEVRDRIIYLNGVEPQFLLLAWALGFVMGMLLVTIFFR